MFQGIKLELIIEIKESQLKGKVLICKQLKLLTCLSVIFQDIGQVRRK